ncbi:histone-lysine N-methyltransferase PR-Set7 [Leptidea sinapis]|uniref:histone-lysine N-methyltransferase PR-Set7 n=1 Tax=Leptidea sinapis TaxID=189913 RepID=UPI002133ACCE|nr:histone-lysine N-methyltransferase PR-Set7 [Leptidea sinapis]
MVRVNSLMATPEAVKTPHRIELCEGKISKPKKTIRKRRIIATTPNKTENEVLNSELLPKKGTKSKPLKSSNGIDIMTHGNISRSRAARAAAQFTESHKLTEYFKEEEKTKLVPPPSPKLLSKPVKVELKNINNNNHKLTEYFPVRRSVRKTSKCVMAEKMRDLERAVREQREDGLQVAYFEGKGRGVIATSSFSRGQFVVEYSGELVGVAEAREREQKYAQDPNAGCYMYYFRLQDQQYCIDATAESGRIGRLVNHSRNGNLCTKALWVDGPRLVLLAAHDISPGEELTYDYGDRSKESLRHHPWLAL